MKNVTIAKHAVLALSLGLVFSAHAQLLGGALGGSIGAMAGGTGSLGSQIGGLGAMGSRAAMPATLRSANRDIDTGATARQRPGAQGSALGALDGHGHASAAANIDTSVAGQMAGSAAQGARGAAQTVRAGAMSQVENTRNFARSSAATARDTASGTARAAAGGVNAIDIQSAVSASAAAGGSGSANAGRGTQAGNEAGN